MCAHVSCRWMNPPASQESMVALRESMLVVADLLLGSLYAEGGEDYHLKMSPVVSSCRTQSLAPMMRRMKRMDS
jgi:hypothetical protein